MQNAKIFQSVISPKGTKNLLIVEDHTTLPALRVRKLSTQMNVGLVGSQEVFGRHADRMVVFRLRYAYDYFSPPCGTCTTDTPL
jgi:hypothetical protein